MQEFKVKWSRTKKFYRSRSRSPYIGSPLNASYAEFFHFMLQFLCLQMCVYGGGAVPQGEVGDRHLVTIPQGVVGDCLPWGGERQGGGRVAMAHHKYLNLATIVTHYMRAHNQWLRMACQGVEEAYLASFRRVSRNFWGDYDRTMRDWCHKSYTEAGNEKQSLLSRSGAASVRHHLEKQAVRLETLSDHWLTNAWSHAWSQKERHLAVESDLVRRLLIKRKRVPSLGGMCIKCLCTNPQGNTCAIQLTVRPTLLFTDGVQFTGSPIRWDDSGLDV